MTEIKGWLAQDIKISVAYIQERNLSLKRKSTDLLIFYKIFKIYFIKVKME